MSACGRRLRRRTASGPACSSPRLSANRWSRAIPDGAYCLFAAPVEGTRQGKTVLVQMRDTADPESGERYTVKRYESQKAGDGDAWRHTAITLHPVNTDFEPIVLTGEDEEPLQVVAEVVEVLGAGT